VRDTRTPTASAATMNDDDDNNTSNCIKSWQLKHLYNDKYQCNQSIENWNMQKSVIKNGPTFLHQYHENGSPLDIALFFYFRKKRHD
jgi:hypothetical protein